MDGEKHQTMKQLNIFYISKYGHISSKIYLKNVERMDIVDNFEIIEGTFVEAQTVNVSSNIQVLQLCCYSFNTPWSSKVCDLMQSLPGAAN